MPFYADLHIHSKYSRATSRDCDLEHLAWWARRKGISVVATGDFTHPAWWEEIQAKLVPAEPGLYRLRPEIEAELEKTLPAACRGAGARPVRFLLEVEISTIYKKDDRTRKVHHLIYAAHLETAGRFRDALGRIGNIASDGRPILGLDSRHLLEITLESGADAFLIPAHIWTPWFAALGSKSGFDSIEHCYGDLSEHIFAVETGLSSDPPMNWRVSALDRYTLVSSSDAHSPPMLGREANVFDTDLDYFAMRRALETGEGFGGTVEFFPEEGKYHLDGHRACGVCLEPEETRARGGACPACGKPLTVGVLHRVEDLADRPEGGRPEGVKPFRSIVPLPEIIAEIHGVGVKTKRVAGTMASLVERLGPELDILERLPLEDVERGADGLVAEAIRRLRAGKVRAEGGYDGEYGRVRLFEDGEVRDVSQLRLFADALLKAPRKEGPPPSASPPPPPRSLPLSPTPVEAKPESVDPPPTDPLLDGLDAEQRAAAEHVEGPLLIVAGPGAGKTRTLTHRLAHLVRGGASPEACLAVTFTRRAAEEMRERLAALSSEAARILVTTFHALGLRILREHHAEVGLDRGFGVADEATVERLAGRGESLFEHDLVSFDDLLALPVRLLEERDDLRDFYRARWRWISIDEYQDIDPVQERLVRLLAPADGNVCAIGDPDQSIYGFRGAEVECFLRFGKVFTGARTIELRRNYRSQRRIVEAARQVIARSSLVENRRFEAASTAAAEKIVLHVAPGGRGEADFVARTIEELLGGTSHFSMNSGRVDEVGGDVRGDLAFCDFAVLTRTRAQGAPFVEALGEAGIPVQARTHERLSARPAVRLLVHAVEGLLEDSAESVGDVRELLVRAQERVASERDSSERDRATGVDAAELDAAIELLKPLAERHAADPRGFLAALALGAEVDTWDPRAERVALMTLHASKGLEWPVVFLVGCDDGLLPLTWPGSDVDLAEERRLAFVGVTRARSRLFLTRARRRSWRGEAKETSPSPFLADIADELLERRAGKRAAREEGPRQLRLL